MPVSFKYEMNYYMDVELQHPPPLSNWSSWFAGVEIISKGLPGLLRCFAALPCCSWYTTIRDVRYLELHTCILICGSTGSGLPLQAALRGEGLMTDHGTFSPLSSSSHFFWTMCGEVSSYSTEQESSKTSSAFAVRLEFRDTFQQKYFVCLSGRH